MFQAEASLSASTDSAPVEFVPIPTADDVKSDLTRPTVDVSASHEPVSGSSRFEPASEDHVIKYESETDDVDDVEALKADENEEVKDESGDDDDDDDDDDEEDSNVCTVHTIADLQNVLKSQEDIQVSLLINSLPSN